MSTSRAKQRSQKKTSRTKKSGSGGVYSYAKNKPVRRHPKFMLKDGNRKRIR